MPSCLGPTFNLQRGFQLDFQLDLVLVVVVLLVLESTQKLPDEILQSTMLNLVDLPRELHFLLLSFLDYPSYAALRAINHDFRSLNLKVERVLEKFIRLETEAPSQSTFLAERDLLPCYWCPVLTGVVIGAVTLLPNNRFEDDTKTMTSVPQSPPSDSIDCLAKYVSGYDTVTKDVNQQKPSLTLFGISCVGGDCAHCVRKALRASGWSEETEFRTYNSFFGPFYPSRHTGCRPTGYCWACLQGPRPGGDASRAQMRRRECDECFRKRLDRQRKPKETEARATSEENNDCLPL